MLDPARTRTWNPLIRSQMPYPLGHGAFMEDLILMQNVCQVRFDEDLIMKSNENGGYLVLAYPCAKNGRSIKYKANYFMGTGNILTYLLVKHFK